jgi:AAA15 family ATPase/GTPase
MYEALQYFGKDQATRKNIEDDARRYADLGISSFNAGKIRHKYGNLEFDLEPEEESSGTRNYIGMSKMLSIVMKNGGIAIIDEFDAYLHFNMFKSLLNKFLDSSHNQAGGQILITTHNLGIFNLVDPKHQIVLTVKDNSGATKLRTIQDRADANYMQKYLNNEYGALPTIHDDI